MTVILIALSVDQPGAQVVVTGVVRQIEGARADGVSIIDGSWEWTQTPGLLRRAAAVASKDGRTRKAACQHPW